MSIAIGDRYRGRPNAGPFAGKAVKVVSMTARKLEFQEVRPDKVLHGMMIWKSSRKRFLNEFERVA